ncbi:MAG: hypothetical protein ACO1OO_16845 [Flavisolibacter sp.]
MVYKFIYIDDTKDGIEQGTINGLQDGREIEITFRYPDDWEKLITELINSLPNFHGIILDLKLNDTPYAIGKSASYRGSTVAQELRTLSKENAIKNDFPIILISADEKLETSLDQTSKDLFDEVVSKNDLGSKIPYASFRNQLKGLADGYLFLNECEKTIDGILKVPQDVVLDIRFTDLFITKIQTQAPHVVARFLIREVLSRPTFLINEMYLATRLGVDMNSEDWSTLLGKYFSDFLYTGAFSNYCSRWWMPLIANFWEKNISTEFGLRNTEAGRKVQLLAEKTGLKNLRPITKAEKSKSNSFWVICKVTQVPIDTIDGFLISGQDDNYPWQDLEYLSVSEALRPTGNYAVSPIEKPRLQKLKIVLEQNEQRVRK